MMGKIMDNFNNLCPWYEKELHNDYTDRYKAYGIQYMTYNEFMVLKEISLDPQFMLAMDKLKAENIVEFNLKISQFKSNTQQSTSMSSQPSGIPKCPTCGSTDIKKISGGKRWLTTGIFGLASSDVGKTMQCNSCGAKW